MKKEKGITLMALIITIAAMLIIAGITIGSGTDSVNETKLRGFYTKLEILQKRIDEIAATNENYKGSNNEIIYIKEQGVEYTNLDDDKKINLQSIINSEGLSIDIEKFRYFTSEEIKNILDVSNIEYNVFIDFDNRIVLVEDGIEIEDKTYYMLEDDKYLVKYNANATPQLLDIDYSIKKYGDDKYKIKIIPIYSDNEKREGTIKYKKQSSQYWKSSNNLEIIIEDLDSYDIIYKDSYNNTKEEHILIESNNDDLTVTKIISIIQ